jgi:hypothetical protein
MNTLLLTLVSIGDLSLRFGFIAVLLGLSVSLTAVGLALRSAPEGHEDEAGFHFKEARPAVGKSDGSPCFGLTMLAKRSPL